MANENLIDQSLAAFFGVFAAFLLEALRRWWADKRLQRAAGNEAVFALAQMYQMTVGMNRQQFTVQIEESKKVKGREPNYSEFLPMEMADTNVLHPRFESLGFLLSSNDPDLLNRLSVACQEFDALLSAMRQLNLAQNEWQRIYASILQQFSGDLKLEQIEPLVGPYLTFRLQSLVYSLQQRLPESSEQLRVVGRQLTEALSLNFPFGAVSQFDHIERNRPFDVPSSARRPRTWRLFVRAAFRLGRRKIW